MPKLLQKNGFSFYFWSEEGNEPPHVHVSKGDGLAKWWLVPQLKAEYSNGFKKTRTTTDQGAYRRTS